MAENNHNDTEMIVPEPLDDEYLLKKTLEVLPTVSEYNNHVNFSFKTIFESIISYLDKCKFSSQENESIHKN